MKQKKRVLKQISPDKIRKNPDNPRLIFRQEEMENLMVSINEFGIQVPLTVYEYRNSYYLLDGERRWRCANKLNLKEVPVIIQERPSELENLLLMTNIHALREQWDYFTIAINLKKIMDLFEKEKERIPNEIELSKETGLTRGQIRRCYLLLDLPDQYKKMLLDELELPKSQQKISEDFFIEMERSLKTVTNRIPEFKNMLDPAREVLIKKYKNGTINAVTDFRQLSKIATAINNIGIKQQKAHIALKKLFDPSNNVSIRDIYKETVEFGYDERKATQQVSYLNNYFDELFNEKKQEQLDEDFIKSLKKLYEHLHILLGNIEND